MPRKAKQAQIIDDDEELKDGQDGGWDDQGQAGRDDQFNLMVSRIKQDLVNIGNNSFLANSTKINKICWMSKI